MARFTNPSTQHSKIAAPAVILSAPRQGTPSRDSVPTTSQSVGLAAGALFFLVLMLTPKQQLKDQRNLTVAFIRKNDRAMGGRGKPRRYDLALVDDFLHRYFREKLQSQKSADHAIEQMHKDIDTYIATSRAVQTGPQEMVGRGGRLP